jgi:XTP/dITP diphosphohydrolase
MATFILATRNAHKAGEIQSVLGPEHTCRTLADFPLAPAVVEDAPTFAGNARKKAAALAAWLRAGAAPNPGPDAWVLADDSGLEVDALDGAPGVLSARFAAAEGAGVGLGNSPDAENNAKLLRMLAGVPAERRSARFRCVIALCRLRIVTAEPADPVVFEGTCEGRVIEVARGGQGFGYDPLFQPAGFEATFAELGDEVKNRISHRARALAAVRSWLEGRLAGNP